MIIVGLVLAIASANVANLLLARARGRRREMAIRQAMGATRLRLVAQLLVESALLSAVAALIGLVIAVCISRAIGSIPLPFSGQVAFNTRIDPLALAFTAAIALGASLAFGLVPAFQTSRVDLVPALKADRNGPPHGRGWLRGRARRRPGGALGRRADLRQPLPAQPLERPHRRSGLRHAVGAARID